MIAPPLNRLSCALLLSCSFILTSCEAERHRAADPDGAPQQPPTEVSFGYIHHLRPPAEVEEPPRELTLAEGAQIRLDDLVLVTSAVELHLCAPTNELTRSTQSLFLPRAHAHVPSSATRHGTPYVEDLLSPAGAARMVGGIAPPAGDYCELHVILTPADDDAINLTDISPEEIEDHTAMVRGTWRARPDEPWQDFQWSSELRRVAILPLFHPQSGQAPLQLARRGSDVLLLLDKELPQDFSDLIQVDAKKGPDFEPLFDDIINSLSIYRYP